MKRLVALSVCALLAACSQETRLPHGYKFFYVAGSIAAVSDWRGNIAVDPSVARYKILEPYLVGERVDANLDPSFSTKYGFFLLDMRSGKLVEGLNAAEFAEALRKRNLDLHPFLYGS